MNPLTDRDWTSLWRFMQKSLGSKRKENKHEIYILCIYYVTNVSFFALMSRSIFIHLLSFWCFFQHTKPPTNNIFISALLYDEPREGGVRKWSIKIIKRAVKWGYQHKFCDAVVWQSSLRSVMIIYLLHSRSCPPPTSTVYFHIKMIQQSVIIKW